MSCWKYNIGDKVELVNDYRDSVYTVIERYTDEVEPEGVLYDEQFIRRVYTLFDEDNKKYIRLSEKNMEARTIKVEVNKIMDKKTDKPEDVINHPSHYTQGIECMDYIESHSLNYARGNVIKYVTRAGLKDKSKTVEDLKKARWYLDREIRNMEKQNE